MLRLPDASSVNMVGSSGLPSWASMSVVKTLRSRWYSTASASGYERCYMSLRSVNG
jgi:hypothetical protein